MMFSSKTPRDLNHDAGAFRCEDLNNARYGVMGCSMCVYDPRPEFDHVQHNAPNPLLIHARLEGIQAALWNLAYAEMEGSWVGDLRVTKEHYHHANRVLPRLANLVKGD